MPFAHKYDTKYGLCDLMKHIHRCIYIKNELFTDRSPKERRLDCLTDLLPEPEAASIVHVRSFLRERESNFDAVIHSCKNAHLCCAGWCIVVVFWSILALYCMLACHSTLVLPRSRKRKGLVNVCSFRDLRNAKVIRRLQTYK